MLTYFKDVNLIRVCHGNGRAVHIKSSVSIALLKLEARNSKMAEISARIGLICLVERQLAHFLQAEHLKYPSSRLRGASLELNVKLLP